jgi:hypothetical protein
MSIHCGRHIYHHCQASPSPKCSAKIWKRHGRENVLFHALKHQFLKVFLVFLWKMEEKCNIY